MKTVNLLEKDNQNKLTAVASFLFGAIIDLPKERRTDDKERTGIRFLVREIGTRNLFLSSVKEPSEAAQFFAIEKAVRSETLGDYASQNSENPDEMKFAGSVTINFGGAKIQASVSGLKAEEDVFIAVTMLAYLLDLSANVIAKMIKENGGLLPACFEDKNHYFGDVMVSLMEAYTG